MPSNPYSGTPKVCRICSTSGARPIDLLNATGICITNPPGWIPAISQLKGGGVRIGSESLDDDTIVAGGYGPVTETFPITISTTTEVAARVQELLECLWEAEQFWLEGWQQGSVYLMVQLTEDHEPRYARIKTGAYQIENYAFGGRAGLPNNTIVLEREPNWKPVPPGEMIGPFRNMIQNPSFERWMDYGLVQEWPSGWVEYADPAWSGSDHLIEREESQIAGNYYGLKMSFTVAPSGASYWYLYQGVRLLPMQDYTLKVWINADFGSGTIESFFIRFLDQVFTTVHNETWNVNTAPSGWVYVHFTTTAEWLYYYLEMGLYCNGTATGSTVTIDRMFLTEGTWTEDTWPGDFYMDSSIVWSIYESERWGWDIHGAVFPRDPKPYVDFDDLPGDVDALMRFALEVEAKAIYDGAETVNMVLEKTAIFAEKRAEDRRYLYDDCLGVYTLGDSRLAESAIKLTAVAEDTPKMIYSRQYNGDDITRMLKHSFNLFLKYAATKDTEVWVGYWTGDPTKEILLAKASVTGVADVYYTHMLLATPTGIINWQTPSTEYLPASIGFNVYVENTEGDGTADISIDGAFLLPSDNGGCYVESPISTGQSLTLDSTSLSKPVQRAYNLAPFSLDDSQNTNEITAIQQYATKLYVFYDTGAGGSSDSQFDGSYWVNGGMTYPGNAVYSTEIFNGQLFMGDFSGNLYYYDEYTDTTVLHTAVGGGTIVALKAFGENLYAAYGTTVASVIGAGGNLAAAPNTPTSLATYKHEMWVGCDSGVTHYYRFGSFWTVGPVLPCADDIVSMIEFKERLYIACVDGDVYYWDGDALTLSRTGAPVTDDNAHQLEVFNGELFLVTGGSTTNTASLFKTSDGITWSTVWVEDEFFATVGDSMAMEVFAGRIAIPMEKPFGFSQWTVIWHAPLIATMDIPDHSGTAITLIPKDRTRVHILYETEDGWYTGYDGDYTNAVKVWVLPRWRALRSD